MMTVIEEPLQQQARRFPITFRIALPIDRTRKRVTKGSILFG